MRGREALATGALEITIVRPDRQLEPESEREHVDVAGVALGDPTSGFGKREIRGVTPHLLQCGLGQGEFVDTRLEEDPPRLAPQQSRDDRVSVDDEPCGPGRTRQAACSP